MQFFQTPNIDFISKRRLAYVISSVLFLVGIGSLILRGDSIYGIDFKGGTSIVLRFEKDISTEEIRDALTSIGMGTSEIKSFGTRNEYVIYVEQQRGVSATDMARRVEGAISESLSNITHEVRKVDHTTGWKWMP